MKGMYEHDLITNHLEQLVKVVFVNFLYYKFTLPCPFLHCTLWKEVTMYNSHLRSEDLGSISLRAEYLHKLFWILLHRKSLFLPFIYSVTKVFISIQTHGYLYFTMGYIPKVYFYFVTQTVSTLITGSLSFHQCAFDILVSLWEFWSTKNKFS